MGKKIKAKERWEVTYEDFKNGKMPKKVEKLTEELETLKKSQETLNVELEKAKNELEYAKSSEQYRKAEVNINKKEEEIKEAEQASQEKQKEIDEEKNKIGKNKDKIENIITFKRMLVEKTAEALEQIEAANQIEEEKKKLEKTIKDLDKEREEKGNKAREIEKKLKQPGISEEEEAKLKEEKSIILKDINENEEKYSEAFNKKREMDNAPATTPGIEDLKKAVLRNEQLIGKCNLIGASLIKGNDIDEISTKLSKFKFSPNPKFAEKIKMAKQNRKEEKTTSIDKIVDEMIADESATAKSETFETETAEQTSSETKQVERTVVATSGSVILEDNEEELANTEMHESESAETDKPAKIGWFARRFPKIAAAGHWVAEKFNNLLRRNKKEEKELDKEEAGTEETVQPETTKTVQNNENGDYDYIIRKVEKMGQDEVLTKITNEGPVGFKQGLYNEAAKIYAENKVKAANHYAETYKGNYYNQDGATVKSDDGKEPGDE